MSEKQVEVVQASSKEANEKTSQSAVTVECESLDNDAGSNSSSGASASNNASPPPALPDWHEIYEDAVELESLLFCIRRRTGRVRLSRLVNNLKQLSGKLKRHEEVTNHLRNLDNATAVAIDANGGSQEHVKRLRDGNSNGGNISSSTDQNTGDESSDDQRRAKKPRAIPLESFSSYQAFGENGLNGGSVSHTKVTLNNKNSCSSGTQTNNTPQLPKSFDHMTKPPTLKSKDKWVHHHIKGSNQHCPDFDASGSCPLSIKCNQFHIYVPRRCRRTTLIFAKEDVDRAYQIHRNISLSKSDFGEKIKTDALNKPNYSCSLTCPIDGTVYYSQPFPGDVSVKASQSYQGIWWYRSMKDARDALSTIVIFDLQDREVLPNDFKPKEMIWNGDRDAGKRSAVHKASQLARRAITSSSRVSVREKNTAPPILPDITPVNWMESSYEKRCSEFNAPQGCALGSTCQYAHVHFPTELNNIFPEKTALPQAYQQIFQVELEDPFFQGTMKRSYNSPFRVMTAVDNQGGLWYTAALKCPGEGTVYYAAGGLTGKLNKQNMVLYPSVEDAKLAVAGVVLESFKKRRLWDAVNRNMPKANKKTTEYSFTPGPVHGPAPAPAAPSPALAPTPPPPPQRQTHHQHQSQQHHHHHALPHYSTIHQVVPPQQIFHHQQRQHIPLGPVTSTASLMIPNQFQMQVPPNTTSTHKSLHHAPQMQMQMPMQTQVQMQMQMPPTFSDGQGQAFQVQSMQMGPSPTTMGPFPTGPAGTSINPSSMPPPPPPPPPPLRTFGSGR